MKRNLSSLLTVFYKLFLPGFWVIGLVTGVIDIFRQRWQQPLTQQIFMLMVWALCAALLYWFCGRLKIVRIDNQFLYVSNYLKEITIPISDIHFVTENKWINIHPVTIHLRSPSALGSKITFMPEMGLFTFFRSHPVVEELRALPKVEKWDREL